MFDDLLRQLKRIPERQMVSIEMQLDDDGYFDRRCPGSECGSPFKVLFSDWTDKVPDEQAWCAICGEVDEPSEFNTPEQQEYIKAHALSVLTGQLDEAFSRARKPKQNFGGFISMTWSYKPGARHPARWLRCRR